MEMAFLGELNSSHLGLGNLLRLNSTAGEQTKSSKRQARPEHPHAADIGCAITTQIAVSAQEQQRAGVCRIWTAARVVIAHNQEERDASFALLLERYRYCDDHHR
jgi:hypothetical protein